MDLAERSGRTGARDGSLSLDAPPNGTPSAAAGAPADRAAARGRPLTATGRRLPVEQFLSLANRLAEALAERHEAAGPHLAITPDSVLVGDAGQVTLAPPAEAQLPYLAPEQTGRLRHGVDERTDLYVVGLLLYQLATGRLPYSGTTAAEWVQHHLRTAAVCPRELVPDLPEPIGELILQLLAKDPHQRYQSCRGLVADLAHCVQAQHRSGGVPAFLRAGRDVRDRLTIRGSLHGRERFLARLATLGERVADGNGPTLACVTAVAGMGKSAFLDGYSDQVVRAGGRAVHGDCAADPHPGYPGFAEAIADLGWQLRGEAEESWRTRLTSAVGRVGDAAVALAPGLGPLIDCRPSAPPRTQHAARQRLHLALRRLLAAVCRTDRPVLLVLDNACALDADGVALLGDLLADRRLRHLFVVLAYEPRRVPAQHPLSALLDRVKAAGSAATVIALRPLADRGLTELLADALRCPIADATRLSHVVAARTGSLPVAVAEFLRGAQERELITFHESGPGWRWKTDELAELPAVADLGAELSRRIGRTNPATRRLLQLAAIAGVQVDLPVLAASAGIPAAEAARALRPAVELEWLEATARVEPDGSYVRAYRWCLDSAQQALLRQLSDRDRAQLHRAALDGLVSIAGDAVAPERFAAVVAHLDGAVVPADGARVSELVRRGRLHGRVGAAAWQIGSTSTARTHLCTAAELLAGAGPACPAQELHAARLAAARAQHEAGQAAPARRLLDAAAAVAATPVQHAEVLSVRAGLAIRDGDRAAQLASTDEALQRLLGSWPSNGGTVPQRLQAVREALTADGPPAADADPDPDPATATAARLIADALSLFTTADEASVQLALRGAELALAGPVHPDAAIAFACCAVAVAGRYGDAELAEWCLSVAMELAAADQTERLTARVFPAAAAVRGAWWTRPGMTLDLLSRAQLAATELGETGWAESNRLLRLLLRFLAGEPLDGIAEELAATAGGPTGGARDTGPSGVDPWAVVRASRAHLTSTVARLRGEAGPDSSDGSATPSEAGAMASGLRVAGLLAAIVLDDPAAPRLSRELAHQGGPAGGPLAAESFFYRALAIVTRPDTSAADDPELAPLGAQLDAWARAAPTLFTTKALLVDAERHRLRGDAAAAAGLYHRAIGAARDRGAPHLEAIAAERAASAALAAGEANQAVGYLRSAADAYRQWNAWARVGEVETTLAQHANVAARQRADELDLIALIRGFQAIAGEPELDRIVSTALELLVKHAGAERGCLLLRRGDTLSPVALAESGPDGIHLASPLAPTTSLDRYAPSTVLEQVRATGQTVSGEAGRLSEEHLDPYLARHRPRALLCAPLIRGEHLVGVVYLEHRERELLAGAGRREMIELLCGQVALAVEHAAARVELRAAERAFDATVERLPSGIAVLAPDLTVRQASPVVAELTGLPVSPGTPLVDFLDVLAPVGAGQGPFRAALLTAIASNDPAPVERRLLVVQPDGQARRLRASAVSIRDDRGALEGIAMLVVGDPAGL